MTQAKPQHLINLLKQNPEFDSEAIKEIAKATHPLTSDDLWNFDVTLANHLYEWFYQYKVTASPIVALDDLFNSFEYKGKTYTSHEALNTILCGLDMLITVGDTMDFYNPQQDKFDKVGLKCYQDMKELTFGLIGAIFNALWI